MTLAVPMPIITASGEEAVVTAWLVSEGEACTEGQLLAQVQAEKVSEDVEAPAAGRVINRVEIGEPILQGDSICEIVEEATVGAEPADPRVEEAASPLAASSSGALRAVIARNMRRAQAETVAVTLHSTVALGDDIPSHFTARVVKAVADTLPRHAELNGHREGETFIPGDGVHVAVAIQTDQGLVAPVVRDAASLSVDDLNRAIDALARRARAKSLVAEDFAGGTFTVTNLGAYGVEGFTPIINFPQIAILGVGAVRLVPVVGPDGASAIGQQVVLSLTFDHAFVDGAPAAMFLEQVGRALGRLN